jgi:hypothetical protein
MKFSALLSSIALCSSAVASDDAPKPQTSHMLTHHVKALEYAVDGKTYQTVVGGFGYHLLQTQGYNTRVDLSFFNSSDVKDTGYLCFENCYKMPVYNGVRAYPFLNLNTKFLATNPSNAVEKSMIQKMEVLGGLGIEASVANLLSVGCKIGISRDIHAAYVQTSGKSSASYQLKNCTGCHIAFPVQAFVIDRLFAEFEPSFSSIFGAKESEKALKLSIGYSL